MSPYVPVPGDLWSRINELEHRLHILENSNQFTPGLVVGGNLSVSSASISGGITSATETVIGALTAGTINSNSAITATNNLVGAGLAVGASPTTITQIAVYSPSLTPVALATSVGGQEQNFTVSGLTTADKVLINPPGQTQNCPLVAARVSGLNTLTLTFDNATAAANVPASGTYLIVAIRS